MTDKVFKYESEEIEVYEGSKVQETTEIEGIFCWWTGYTAFGNDDGDYFTYKFVWNFDWTKLKNEGVNRLTGHLIVKPSATNKYDFDLRKIDIDWRKGKETIFEVLSTTCTGINAVYEYHLTAHYGQQCTQMKQVSYDEMLAASDKTDAVLVVEGKKIHVNKAFLSFHSDFFTALFSSNFKEGQLAEIPIKDVSYEDFGLLMSAIYPKQVFPNDKTAPKLLELADRFLMPCVTNLVEHHLLNNSQISNEKMMWMADAYGMPTLLEKCIRVMDTKEKAKTMQKSEEYQKKMRGLSEKQIQKVNEKKASICNLIPFGQIKG